MKASKMPFGCERLDALPGPIECDGQRLRWVGFTFIDEGEADGTEPLVITQED